MEELFRRWECTVKHSESGFVRDGIIDKEKWTSNLNQGKPKILFILKEAFSRKIKAHDLLAKSENEPWDLRLNIRDKLKSTHHTWWNCALWSYGIQQIYKNGTPPQFPDWKEAKWVYKKNPEVREALLSSAIINIKKSNGKSKSTNDDLLDYAEKDKTFIREQVDLINPDIIICGCTWPVLVEANVFKAESQKISDWIYECDGKTFVDYWHPQQRRSPKIDYYAITTAIYHWRRWKTSKR